MKISLSKFYTEVTGTTTVNRGTTTKALTRWGVPFDESGKRGDVVDIVHLSAAKATHAAEVAAAKARKPAPAHNGSATGDADVVAAIRRVEAKLDDIYSHLTAPGSR